MNIYFFKLFLQQSTKFEQTREVPAELHTINRQPIVPQRSSVIVDLTQVILEFISKPFILR